MNLNRKQVVLFIEDFRRKPYPTEDRLDSSAQLIRDLTVTAVKHVGRPLKLSEIYQSIVDQRICNFEIHWAFFLSSLCSRMEQSGIVICGGKVHIL